MGYMVKHSYDVMDRLSTRTDPLNRSESYVYDRTGNLTQFLDRKGQVATFTYDSLNRRIQASYADGSRVDSVYDAGGRLTHLSDSLSGAINFTYDNLDRLIQEITAQGSVSYSYDMLGRRTSMTLNGQVPVAYGYDPASRLTQVAQGSQAVGLGYDLAGRRIALKKLQKLFQHKVLKLLLKEKRISREWVEKLLSWRNSGFNIHNQVKIRSDDSHGRESLAQYILRSPFSQEKMTYREETKSVLYRTKIKPGAKKNFAVFPVLDWIVTLTAHIPNKGEQLVRYYGYYSNVSRGKRKKEEKTETSWKPEVIEVTPPPASKELKKRWSHFIRKVYETDPLTCPKCQGEMRIISFIDQPEVIKKILQHLGLWEESHAPPGRRQKEKEITFDPSYSQLV